MIGFVPRHVRDDGVAEAVGERAVGHLADSLERGGDIAQSLASSSAEAYRRAAARARPRV